MRKRFKYPLTVIGIIICALLFLGVCYFFYDRFVDDAIVLADGNLSINFINGNKFDQKHNKKLKFTVINNSEETSHYYIQFTEVSGNANYSLVGKDNSLSVNAMLKSGVVSSFIEINGGEIQNYQVEFNGNGNYKGIINIAKEASNYDTFADIIFKSTPPKEDMVTKFGEAATTNEGLIMGKDDFGTTYFYRGKVDNNYVKFADYTWRIVRVNGDGSVRLVLDGLLDTNSKYYESGFQYSESAVKDVLNDFYTTKLSEYADFIATSNFCNDITTQDGNYTSYNRIFVDNIISFNCLSEKYLSTIGLLTTDEAVAAGGAYDIPNNNYYLYNPKIGKNYYLMSSYKAVDEVYYPYIISTQGTISSQNGTTLSGVRPVINIIKNITVTGKGTSDNPYVIKTIDSE